MHRWCFLFYIHSFRGKYILQVCIAAIRTSSLLFLVLSILDAVSHIWQRSYREPDIVG